MIYSKILLTLQPFVVNLNELRRGVSQLSQSAGKEFFESFGNQEILDADIKVEATVNNHGVSVDVEADITGTVTVLCDRCLERLEIPVETGFEETYTPEGAELDFRQEVYDFVCIALPLQRVHEDGQCNPETTKYLSK